MTLETLTKTVADEMDNTADALRDSDFVRLEAAVMELSSALGSLKKYVDQLGEGMSFQWMVPYLVKALGIKAGSGQSFNVTQLRQILSDVGLDLHKMDDETLRRSMRAVMKYDLLAQHGVRLSKFYSGGYVKYQAHRIYDEEDV